MTRLCHLSVAAALVLGCGGSSSGDEPAGSTDGTTHFASVDSNSGVGDQGTSSPDAGPVTGDGSTSVSDAPASVPDASGAMPDVVTSPDVASPPPEDAGSVEEVQGPPPSQEDVFVEPPDPTLAEQPLAGVCATGEDCETPDCNNYYPGGYCTLWCGSTSECPDGGKCYKDPLSGDKMCWKACEVPEDCRVDQFCGGGVCTPKCWEGSCQLGYECDTDSGQCLEIGSQPCIPEDEVCDGVDNDCDDIKDEGCGPQLAPHPYVEVDDLGLVSVGGGGVSKTLKAWVDEDTTTLSLLVIDADGSNEIMAFWKVYDPDDVLVLDATDPLGSPVRGYPEIQALTVQIPNTPDVPLKTGAYDFSVFREGDDLGAVWVYAVRTVRPQVTTSFLDVNFWFVGTPTLTAQTAQTSSKFNKVRNTFVELMSYYGVTCSQVNYFDVIGVAAQKYTFVDVGDEGYVVDEHAELIALSESLPEDNRGVNFFFIQGFNGYGLLGKAGGIPGPPLLQGSYHSGVVV
ncbi:MAG: hypothetical protein QF464_09420, partial [Myxococcota bacterium]|nr:hypothetical protein [Myxococcota bacterium]